MSHLQIYPTPLLNHGTSSHGGSLRLGGYIKLDHMVNDVQGCDFVTSVKLICASDDDSRTLFRNEKPLVEVDLATSLQDGSVTGHVVDLGSIPQESSCSGTFEAEGIDYDVSTGILRVEIIPAGLMHLENDGLRVQALVRAKRELFTSVSLPNRRIGSPSWELHLSDS